MAGTLCRLTGELKVRFLLREISEVSAGKLSPLQVDSPTVACVARCLRMEVKVEGGSAGDDVMFPSGHTEGVENISTEPGEGLVGVPAVHVGVRDQNEVVPVRLAGVGRVAVTAAADTVQVPAVRAGGRAELQTAVADLSPHTHCVVQAS